MEDTFWEFGNEAKTYLKSITSAIIWNMKKKIGIIVKRVIDDSTLNDKLELKPMECLL